MSLSDRAKLICDEAVENIQKILDRAERRLVADFKQEKGEDRASLASMAEFYHIDPPRISRIRHGVLPKSDGAYLRAIEPMCLARDEKRVALTMLAAHRACSGNEPSKDDVLAGELYLEMMQPPSFMEGQSILTSPDVRKLILLTALKELGLTVDIGEMDVATLNLDDKSDGLALNLVRLLHDQMPDVYQQLKKHDLGTIIDSFRRARQTVTFDPNNPGVAKRQLPKRIQVTPPDGLTDFWLVRAIPNVTIAFMKLVEGTLVEDKGHRHAEFVAVTRGEGTLSVGKNVSRLLSSSGAQIAAYSADQYHSFRCESELADIYIVTYERPSKKANQTIAKEIIERMSTFTVSEITG